MESIGFCETKKWCKVFLCKDAFLADLVESQYLFEIYYTPVTIKNNENVVKGGCFKKPLRWRAPIFLSKLKRDIGSLLKKY